VHPRDGGRAASDVGAVPVAKTPRASGIAYLPGLEIAGFI
jgi:hypothetical protein